MRSYLEDGIGFVDLVDSFKQDVALKVVNSARVSYNKKSDSWSENDQRLTKFLWDNKHTSPYRHSYYTFHIKAPIFVFRQWMKHQIASDFKTYEVNGDEVSLDIFSHFYDEDKGCSWNEISGRYVEWKPEFYIPKKMRKNPPHGNKQHSEEVPEYDPNHTLMEMRIREASSRAFTNYQELLDMGVAKELARMVLPQNLYSEAYWTVSLQSILNFLELRLDPHAQYEIREYAKRIKLILASDLNKLGIDL